jgi:Mrp family chromosome partitioning ATPase
MEITQLRPEFDRSVPLAPDLPVTDVPGAENCGTSGLASGDAMQAGARLKLVLGSDKRLVAIGGIKAEDGSSLLTASLGAALANLEQNRVLVVDANTRNSRLSKIFGIAEGEGFLNVLEEEADIDQLTKLASPSNLDFLGLGRSCR